jgi:DedD protein
MALFKFRKGSDDSPAPAPQTDSVEAIRRRARHRLIGAAVLVLVGVIGFPLLFDNQPRPISVDIPIEIPDKTKVKPLTLPVTPPAAQPAAAPEAPAAVVTESKPPATEIIEEKAAAAPVVIAQTAPKIIAKTEPKETPKAADKPAAKPDDGATAQALLEGKDGAKKELAAEGRYVVQVGAFADAAKAREVRLKVERAGLKTYTQVVQTKDGSRVRVRVGPFAGKAEADKAAEKIKKLDLPAVILTL